MNESLSQHGIRLPPVSSGVGEGVTEYCFLSVLLYRPLGSTKVIESNAVLLN